VNRQNRLKVHHSLLAGPVRRLPLQVVAVELKVQSPDVRHRVVELLGHIGHRLVLLRRGFACPGTRAYGQTKSNTQKHQKPSNFQNLFTLHGLPKLKPYCLF